MPQEPHSSLLRLNLLGEPQILLDGTPLTGFISSKAQALLIYLASTRSTHTRDSLATLFWDEMPEASAKKNLTKALSNLRKLVGGWIEIDSGSAGLAWDRSPQVDTFLLGEAMAEGNSDLLPLQVQEAVALYRGDFLAGFNVKDSPLFDEWAWTERERLHQMAIQGLQRLSQRLATTDDVQAIIYLQRLLELDPLHESAHGQLMMALARMGQRSAALSQYEAFQTLLADELGVEPNSELRALFERLKRSGEPVPHNIPPLAPIIGRDIESSEILALLNDPSCRLLTIVGPGGIGKTELALHIGAKYTGGQHSGGQHSGGQHPVAADAASTTFPDGVFLVSLAPLANVDSLLAAIAEALGLAFQENSGPLQQLNAYLKSKSLLLIMDNFEHLLPSEHNGLAGKEENSVFLFSQLLDQSAGLKILATSRTRLGIQVEHVFHLAGVECPLLEPVTSALPDKHTGLPIAFADQTTIATDADVADWSSYGAVQLFDRCARRLRPDFALTSNNIQSVVGICNLVQGMPLGILLAASWIAILSPAEILTELSHGPELLETQEHDVPPRQRSIRGAFDYTWQMLSQREQEIYQKLAVFRGNFTRQAAQYVANASLRELMSMVDKSLVAPLSDGRFALHGLLRQFGLERLAQSPLLEHSAQTEHACYFANLLGQRALAFKGPEQQYALLETEADNEDMRLSWQWVIEQIAAEQATIEPMSQIIDGLCQFYAWRGRFHEGEFVAKRSAEALAASSNQSDEKACLYGHILGWQGKLTRNLGRADDAIQLITKGLGILDGLDGTKLETRPERAFAYLNLGDASREIDRDAARCYYEASLDLYRATDDQWGMANTFAALGWLIQHWGDYNEALAIYQESLAIRQTLGDRRGEAESLRAVGGVALYQGDLEKAEQLTHQSIVIADVLGDSVGKAGSLGKLGETLIALGQFKEAQEPLLRAQAIFTEMGLGGSNAFIDAILGLSYLHQGHYEQARDNAEKALAYFQKERSRRGIAYASLVTGWTLLVDDRWPDAQFYLEQANALYAELGQQDELGQSHALLGLCSYLSDLPLKAERHLQSALSISENIQACTPRVLVIAIAAWRSEQQPDEERRYLDENDISNCCAERSSYPLISESLWFKNLALRH